MNKPRKYVTKALVKRIYELTNNIFKQSVIEVLDIKGITNKQMVEFMLNVRRVSYSYVMNYSDEYQEEVKDLMEKKEKIDELYLNKMLMLSSKDLSDILFLHGFGKPKRAERTLEMIKSELMRRALFNDSSQSDTIYKHGNVGVKRKSKSLNKRVSNKKLKVNK